MSEADWPKYESHKIVRAAPIFDIVDAGGQLHILVKPYGDDRVERFVPTESAMIAHAEIGGYGVIYDGDYRSVSPKAAFEAGYALLA